MAHAKDGESTLQELLLEVHQEGKALTEFFNSNSYYQPSFRNFKEYPELPEDVQQSRQKLREAAKAVYDLATGPTEHLYNLSWSVSYAIIDVYEH